jgi:hypothetical protein
MDSIPNYEFYNIFDRVSDKVNLKGKFSVEEIEEALARSREHCRKKYEGAETQKERAMFKNASTRYSRLMEYGFAQRVIQEAVKNPRGIIAMTLKYGKTEAGQRILAQKRTQMRMRFKRQYRH